MDLLGRKVPMKGGAGLQYLLEEINRTIDAASGFPALQKYVGELREATGRMGKVLAHLQQFAAAGNTELYMADANLFMELSCLTVVGWQWLKQGIVAVQKLNEGGDDFSHSKIETLKFFYRYELPKTIALARSLMNEDVVTIKTNREILI
jgi:butyryl-CoA dehydrogenase